VWIEFFRKPESALTLHLKRLLRERRVIMVGIVLAEILQGVRDPKESNLVREHLSKLPYVEVTRGVWETAGTISSSLRRKGITIPLSDLVVAASALSENLQVFTTDPHFKKVSGLALHKIQV
jgi:predicted nucleic acid-binding protein